MSVPQPTPPGWYYDAASGMQRWWAGDHWTEHFAPPAQPAMYAGPGPQRVVVQQRPLYKTSHGFHLMMTLLTLGLWGLFVWLPIGILNAIRN